MTEQQQRQITTAIWEALYATHTPLEASRAVRAVDWEPLIVAREAEARLLRTRTRGSDYERFMTHVQSQADGCLVWTGAGAAKGRPTFFVDSRFVGAARWLYGQRGASLPRRLKQTCATPNCVNPDHYALSAHEGAEDADALDDE